MCLRATPTAFRAVQVYRPAWIGRACSISRAPVGGSQAWLGEEGWDVGQESLLTKWVGLLPTLFQMVGKAHGAQRAWEQVLSPPCSLPSTLRASVSPCTRREVNKMGCGASGVWDLRVSCSLLGSAAPPNVLPSEASQDSLLLSRVGKRVAGSEPQLSLLTAKWFGKITWGPLGPAVGD